MTRIKPNIPSSDLCIYLPCENLNGNIKHNTNAATIEENTIVENQRIPIALRITIRMIRTTIQIQSATPTEMLLFFPELKLERCLEKSLSMIELEITYFKYAGFLSKIFKNWLRIFS
uniref:Uncharacterized protein n=1 Tax=Pithovirus LCPAC202 TaxID=2506592 RepID=A0A481Z8T7_9VIRU|nr:MAG: hypothetical protein LCPAC202_00650 [Pithovirus LCPAC202]